LAEPFVIVTPEPLARIAVPTVAHTSELPPDKPLFASLAFMVVAAELSALVVVGRTELDSAVTGIELLVPASEDTAISV
jgi:hypothetical protein